MELSADTVLWWSIFPCLSIKYYIASYMYFITKIDPEIYFAASWEEIFSYPYMRLLVTNLCNNTMG